MPPRRRERGAAMAAGSRHNALGAAMFDLFYSFLAGLLMAASLYVFARWATKRDPKMLRILLSSSRFRARYDAAKHAPFDIEVRTC